MTTPIEEAVPEYKDLVDVSRPVLQEFVDALASNVAIAAHNAGLDAAENEVRNVLLGVAYDQERSEVCDAILKRKL